MHIVLQEALGNVSFTADVWDSKKRQAFLAITGHWVAEVKGAQGSPQLEMRSALLAFKRIRGRHQGDTLGQVLFEVLQKAEISTKVRCSTHH